MSQGIIDEREHRRELVLGLTLAEVLLLLLFLLLLALGARLQKFEREKEAWVQAREALEKSIADLSATPTAEAANRVSQLQEKVSTLEKENSELKERLTEYAKVSGDPQKLGEITTILEEARRINPNDPPVSLKIALAVYKRVGIEQMRALSQMGPDVEVRIVANTGGGARKHNWPPIISLSEAEGFYFESGSAELSPAFREALTESVIPRLLEILKEYDVNVIEVIGHTDEQHLVVRGSNLDAMLVPFMQGKTDVRPLIAADNAGLGFARAASVARVLMSDSRLAELRVLPFSGAQVIDVGDALSTGTLPEIMEERRRIEVRVRRSDKEPRAAGVVPGKAAETKAPDTSAIPQADKEKGAKSPKAKQESDDWATDIFGQW